MPFRKHEVRGNKLATQCFSMLLHMAKNVFSHQTAVFITPYTSAEPSNDVYFVYISGKWLMLVLV